MADHIAVALEVRVRESDMIVDDADRYLKRIIDSEGHDHRPATAAEAKSRNKMQIVLRHNCWHCKQYSMYVHTSWQCKECDTPICRVDRCKLDGQPTSCLHEHLNSNDGVICCGGAGHAKPSHFPADKKRKLNDGSAAAAR